MIKDLDLNQVPAHSERIARIVDPKERPGLEYLSQWYKTYQQLQIYVGTISAGLLYFTVKIVIKDLGIAERPGISDSDILRIKLSVGTFVLSFLFVVINILTTYNWFITGVEGEMKRQRIDYGDVVYRKTMGSIKLWGRLSWMSGALAWICVTVGILAYISWSWRLVDLLLNRLGG